jgi:hypothetical protein
MNPPDNILKNLSSDASSAFVTLIERLDAWLSKIAIGERDQARRNYGAFVEAFLGKYQLESTSNVDFDSDDYSTISVWWSEFSQKITIIKARCLLHGDGGDISPPNPDLSDDIQQDYQEARAIVGRSPRGAAALLRLCIQKICRQLGEPGKNINDDIGALVKKGLPRRIQQALDIVRVVGNDAVHPGQIDIDNEETAKTLFRLVNVIADRMISEELQINEIYQLLPRDKLHQIEKRDGSGEQKK